MASSVARALKAARNLTKLMKLQPSSILQILAASGLIDSSAVEQLFADQLKEIYCVVPDTADRAELRCRECPSALQRLEPQCTKLHSLFASRLGPLEAGRMNIDFQSHSHGRDVTGHNGKKIGHPLHIG